ncbi:MULTISPECIES: hypothetical protein [Bacillus cereus group]|uniref:Uncharacterized protein n=1 Tax=Bacillus cereus TaxID=1396 RepID=A0AA44TDQ9_BACCE|nr:MULTISPECIES: hypothetical protein [Bacillus cereus group]PFA24771.1 hypothetical protein CN373_02695 [Bacillus cereus]PFN09126.1 hypothetical protein COJ55_03845 [Bacillus cereus]PFO83014.1 hypothetical protein COJ77_10425 [Bacillus cereus]PFR99222.1 hypothetical protein COK38_16600 [Bacillus cereus]PGZ13409.1 hypothetical protein COE46_21210 [Bacillus cereus]
MKKFAISFLYSLLSLVIAMNILQLYDGTNIFEGEAFINMLRITVVVGVPVVLFGCMIGEVLFKYFILPSKLHFMISLWLYILLGAGIVFIFEIISGGVPTVYENLRIVAMMYYMGLAIICSVTFFIRRTIYE